MKSRNNWFSNFCVHQCLSSSDIVPTMQFYFNRGSCGKRKEVAVKRILRDNEALAEKEVKNLVELESEGKNVIR